MRTFFGADASIIDLDISGDGTRVAVTGAQGMAWVFATGVLRSPMSCPATPGSWTEWTQPGRKYPAHGEHD